MDFGKVEITETDKVDFTLAEGPSFTKETLKQSKPATPPKVYFGCAKWGRKEWMGNIYPERTKEADFLNEYVKHFNSVELNATHYKMPEPENIGIARILFLCIIKMKRIPLHYAIMPLSR